jgi:hypothetical protein
LSHDGNVAVFGVRLEDSAAPGGLRQIVRRDIAQNSGELISVSNAQRPGNNHSLRHLMSSDGRVAVFESYASDLINADRNNQLDIFIYRPISASPDADNDGLPDEWELTFFNSVSPGANDDTDGDGSSNLQEFRAGTNPANNASVLAVAKFEAILSQRVALVWHAVPGKSYQVEQADEVGSGTWTPIGPPQKASSELASFEVSAVGALRQFYRVRLVE